MHNGKYFISHYIANKKFIITFFIFGKNKIKIAFGNKIWFENVFYNFSSLKSLNFSKFKDKDIVHTKYIFNYCNSLNNLDISHFNENNNIYMDYIVYNWNNLQFLNLSNFFANDNTAFDYLFEYL